MIRSATASFFALLLLFALGSCRGTATPELSAEELDHPSFLWEVEKDGTRAWLFGTMHFTDPEVTTLGLEVHQALDAADAIFTEVIETPTSGAIVSQAGSLPDGQSLADIVSPELLQRLHGYLKSRRLPVTSMDSWRPWMVSLQIGQLDAIPYLSPGVKLDVQLMHRAEADGKEFGAVKLSKSNYALLLMEAWKSKFTCFRLV